MDLNYNSIMKVILKSEGGYSNHPFDRGGPTNMGITQAVLSSFRGRQASVSDVKNLTLEEAMAIYKKNYWDKIGLDRVEDGVLQLILFDQGVNRGTKTAVIQAQVVLGELGHKILVDGVLGSMTAAALNEISEYKYSREYLQASELAYADICVRRKSQLVFLKGWLNRVHRLQDIIFDFNDNILLPPIEKVQEEVLPDNQVEQVTDVLAPFRWAQGELDQKEISGRQHNPRIVWYHSFTTLKATDDETPWCSSFMCAAAESTGFKSTRSAAAKSWASYGEVGDGSVGDIAVFTRDGGNHVGFVNSKFNRGDSSVSVLGGNQSNSVCVSNYSASRLIGFRRFKSS